MLTPYGLREWVSITVVCALLGGGAALAGWWWPVGVVVVVWLAVLGFFRDPLRTVPIDLPPGDMLSPADGCVSAVERVEDHPLTGGAALVVRIFLSVLNVHVNRSPTQGTVCGLEYKPGRFHDARSPECPTENESNLITMRMPGGERIGVRQIAGKIARRIVCPLELGDQLTRGQKFGMIKFGSSTELILPRPDDVTVHVAVGDRVRGGRTLLASLAAPEAAHVPPASMKPPEHAPA